jgi:hypothetical protein
MVATMIARRESLAEHACNLVRVDVACIVNHQVNARVRDRFTWFEYVAHARHDTLRLMLPSTEYSRRNGGNGRNEYIGRKGRRLYSGYRAHVRYILMARNQEVISAFAPRHHLAADALVRVKSIDPRTSASMNIRLEWCSRAPT